MPVCWHKSEAGAGRGRGAGKEMGRQLTHQAFKHHLGREMGRRLSHQVLEHHLAPGSAGVAEYEGPGFM